MQIKMKFTLTPTAETIGTQSVDMSDPVSLATYLGFVSGAYATASAASKATGKGLGVMCELVS